MTAVKTVVSSSAVANQQLEAIRKSHIAKDRRGVEGQRVEKRPRLKAGKVEREDDVPHGGPANLGYGFAPISYS